MNKEIIESELKKLDEDPLRLLRKMLENSSDYPVSDAQNHIDRQALLNLIANEFIEWVDDWRSHVRLTTKAHAANKLIYECPLCAKTHNGGIWKKDLSLCSDCIKDSREHH